MRKKKFHVNWRISGVDRIGSTHVPQRLSLNELGQGMRDAFEPGDVVEAALEEVGGLVAVRHGGTVGRTSQAVLTPLDGLVFSVHLEGHDVDLDRLNAKELAEHARVYHFMGRGNEGEDRVEMLRRIREARQAEASDRA